MNQKSFSLTSRSVLGVLILLLGIVLTLGNFDIIDAPEVIRFWPVLLVLFGLLKALQPGGTGGRVFGGAIAFIGAMMILNRLDMFNFDFWDFWPLLLVAIGASLVFRTRSRPDFEKEDSANDFVRGTAILGGIEQKNSSQQFRGGEISAVLGGHTLDLRDAEILEHDTATLDLFTFMGGVELRVPQNWTIIVEGSAFMGGFENKTRGAGDAKQKLIIKGQAIMGGVEITN
ncbi:MAG: hypothetical protein C0600_13760 [Ignavibacteria bacterium]|nr:MAG: hypothetical protein C0600_13760 [Ignavibacteria bacterium]